MHENIWCKKYIWISVGKPEYLITELNNHHYKAIRINYGMHKTIPFSVLVFDQNYIIFYPI